MTTSWTAVVKKDNNIWKLVKVHFSANILDNPVLDYAAEAAKRSLLITGLSAAFGGILVGFFIKSGKKQAA